MKVAIIGGGAAGFFAAINCKENYPDAYVVIYEKTKKVLSKVAISGGGRCNVCNGETSIATLSKAYPRGGRKLKKIFKEFSTKDTFDWFQKRGVKLYTQEDNRVFPTSNDSQTIIDCFLKQIKAKGIPLEFSHSVQKLVKTEKGIKLQFKDPNQSDKSFDKVILACGGSPKRAGMSWLEELGHEIVDPVPSLFTFNMPNENITSLMGVVAPNAMVKIEGIKLQSEGPLLITHWGMSGPAILKLSAFGARLLHELDYKFKAIVNWVNVNAQNDIVEMLESYIKDSPDKQLHNIKPYKIPERLWLFLLNKIDLPKDKKWRELGKKSVNKMVNILAHDVYEISGKTTFKEEFVTSGGVSLNSIDFQKMRSKKIEGLYLAGEMINVDGITGGYNFQAAWTTGFIAAKLL